MSDATPRDPFDLFISYAHVDDQGEHAAKVSALVEAIKADYRRVTGTTLNVFFDTDAIRTMDDWEGRIRTGLRHARMMVAVLSPAYFASDYCRKEWEAYIETELAHALPGEGIAPIYVVEFPAFEPGAPSQGLDARLKPWIKDLKKRQYIEWRSFWPEGARALERDDARQRLEALPGQIAERLQRGAARDAAPNSVPLPSSHFAGRRDELLAVRHALIEGHIGAITAVHGIAGIGKSMLAFAYAWGYGFAYPGGRFLIPAANLSDLAAGVIALAELLGLALSDEERRQPEVALARVKAALEHGPPVLLVIDNVDDAALLSPQARDRALPRGDHIHVLVTTRVSPDDLPRLKCLPLDALEPPDAMALLQSFRPIADAPQDDEWKAALEIVTDRLAGHALAVEVVGVFLRENPEVSYRQFAESLQRDGIRLLEDQVGPEARGRLDWHAESCIGRLLEPTLSVLDPAALRAVEYAAWLPPDDVPLPWLRTLLLRDFPDLAPDGLRDPINAVFQHLQRLRLVVPLPHERTPGATPAEPAGAPRLARMHRLVQDVVRTRLGDEDGPRRAAVIHRHTDERSDWLQQHWGQVDLAWELLPLRDLALRWIDQGHFDGVLLSDRIETPLLHTGRLLDAGSLLRRCAQLLERRSAAAPENAVYASDLSVSFIKLGDLAVSSGDPAAARRFYADSLAIRQRLSAAAPENADYARDLSISFNKLGKLAVSGGDPAAARRYYADGLAIAQRLSAAAPENAVYARDLAISFERLGDLAVSGGDPAAARRYYADSMAIRQRLSAAAPENADYAHDLSFGFDRLGNLADDGGDPAAARRYYADGLAIAQRLSAAAPENADYARDLSIRFERLGDLALSGGDPAAARRYYADSLAIAQRLSAAAPENAVYTRDLSINFNRLGDLAVSDGDPATARRYYADGLAIAQRLSVAAPENADYARDLSISFNKLGNLAVSGGDPAAARRYYADGLVIRQRLSAAAPENADYARDLSITFTNLGDLARAGGDPAAARRYYADGLAIFQRLSAAAPENADDARGLWALCWRMAMLAEAASDPAKALTWWRQAHDVLSGMKQRGLFISPANEGFLKQLAARLGR